MSGGDGGFDVPRLARILALIAFVTAAFVLVASTRLSGTVLTIGVGAIGAVAMVTAITGALIAAAETIGSEVER